MKDLLSILCRCHEQGFEVRILLLLLVASIIPCLDGFPAPDDDMEERVQKKYDVPLQGGGIEEHRLGRTLVERVLQQGRLDHHEGVHCVFPKDDCTVVRRLVRACIEGLQKVTPAQVVHELREDGKFLRQVKGRRFVLAIVGKLRHQPDEHAVDPTQDVQGILILSLEHSIPGHEHCSSLLIEASGNVAHGGVRVAVGDRGDTQPLAARRVEVERLELQKALPALRDGIRLLIGNVEVEPDRGVLI
mmetsp:Transcript_56832/g.122903  ORF Transcript_56832/g.122903 Transcript_56832/m.122903 type:complete len:246 (+) Transcript_56832:371-1108(+)